VILNDLDENLVLFQAGAFYGKKFVVGREGIEPSTY